MNLDDWQWRRQLRSQEASSVLRGLSGVVAFSFEQNAVRHLQHSEEPYQKLQRKKSASDFIRSQSQASEMEQSHSPRRTLWHFICRLGATNDLKFRKLKKKNKQDKKAVWVVVAKCHLLLWKHVSARQRVSSHIFIIKHESQTCSRRTALCQKCSEVLL